MSRDNKPKEIIYIGQDLTSIDKAFVIKPNQTAKLVDEKDKEVLWEFLEKCNKNLGSNENDLIIVGHSDEKKAFDEKRKYKLTSVYSSSKNKDSEDDEIVDSVLVSGLLANEDNDSKDGSDSSNVEEESLQKENRRFGQLVGTIRGTIGNGKYKKTVKVIINSRFDVINQVNPLESKPYFLASLLLKGKLKFSKNSEVDFNHESLFDFYMIWIMKKHFEDAMLQGFFKKYQRFERNDDRLRGSIDISKHIQINMGMDNGKIAYSYRENSMDNMVNHLILSAYDYLEDKYPDIVMDNFDSEFEMQIRNLKYAIGYPKYDRRTLINKNSIPISHPFFSDYRLLQADCLKILRDEGVSPFGSKDESISGIVYYVPDLWEEYLEDYIKAGLKNENRTLSENETDKEKTISMYVEPQKTIKVMVGMQNNNRDLEEANKRSGGHSTYPDYVFSYRYNSSEKDHYFFILDAKYKYYWPDALDGILASDILGDYDKCIRDMESIGGTGTGVMFPIHETERSKHGTQYRHRFSVYNDFGTFYTLPIVVPDIMSSKGEKVSFPEWDVKMRKNISSVMEYLGQMLCFEAKKHEEKIKAEARINKKLEEISIPTEIMYT